MAGGREIRIAAVADLHHDVGARGGLREVFVRVSHEADILALCGDLTTHGRPDQMESFAEELATVEIPTVAVLGNHDYDSDSVGELTKILRDRGVFVLDGEQVTIEGIGFAGVKGFGGGFGRGTLAPFGEALIKAFVQHTIEDALKLENALRTLTAEVRVVLLHYAPIVDTLVGEPEPIYPFLGSSRLLAPVETFGATAVFHGHAHNGTAAANSPAGVPVYNVALPLLQRTGASYRILTVEGPERRGGGGRPGGPSGLEPEPRSPAQTEPPPPSPAPPEG